MIHVGDRLDSHVDPAIDLVEVTPGGLRHHDVTRLRGAAPALAGIFGAEFDPADRCPRRLAEARENDPFVAGACLRTHPQQHGNSRQLPSLEVEHRSPRFICWDYVWHKGFALPLNRPSRFEENESKSVQK